MKSFAFIVALIAFAGLAQADSARPSVLLLRFKQIDESTDAKWVGEAVQRSLQADLSRGAAQRIQLPAQNGPSVVTDDPAAVAHLAHDASADYIVAGQFQMIDDQIRLTGQLFDGRDGHSIGSLKATGMLKNLFDMEDALAGQIQRDLRTASGPKPAIQSAVPAMEGSGPLRMAARRPLPVGTVEVRYSSRASQIGRDRYIYMNPLTCGCGGDGFSGYSFPCFGGFGGGGGGAEFATGGTGSLAY